MTVSKGGLELQKYVYLLVLWIVCWCWSDCVFASTYAYVLMSDTRSFRVVRGQSDDKLLTSDTGGS